MNNPPRVTMILTFDDRKRLTDFFVILVAIDRRARTKSRKVKKVAKAKTKRKQKGSRVRALFFVINRIIFEALKSILF